MGDYDAPPPPRGPRVVRPSIPSPWRPGRIAQLVALLVALAAGYGFYEWFIVRVEIPPEKVLVLVNKTGRTLPTTFGDQVVLYPALVDKLAAETGKDADWVRNHYKGIVYEPVTEGRHWYSPIWYKRTVVDTTVVPSGKLGVLIRRYGKPLPIGKTVATTPDERGPVEQPLPPGRHNVNTLAYDVQIFDAIRVPEGHVGVVTLLTGNNPAERNAYTVQVGERGVQPDTLGPGLYYVNPYLKKVDVVDVRSHKYDMLGADAIQFPSNDSFTITLEATIEWAIQLDKAPWVVVVYGDEDDIVDKVILPYARSLSRIQGSKLLAREFISGKSRTEFQNRFKADLVQKCRHEGVEIKSALIRRIAPPGEIMDLISQRELADQLKTKFENQIAEAEAEARLVEQQELRKQNASIGDANKQVVTLVQQAEESRGVALTEASQRLEVAKLELQAAEKLAAAKLALGEAEGKVIFFGYQAEAEPLAAAVRAFETGEAYAQNLFMERLAPAIQSIMSNTEGTFAEIFKQFQSFEGGGRRVTSDGPRQGRPAVTMSEVPAEGGSQ